jgi:RING-variant domain
MPAAPINEPSDPGVESADVVLTFESPDEPSVPPQEQEQQENESTRATSPPSLPSSATAVVIEKDNPTASTSTSLEECRICLMSDEVEQLIKPCHCTGSGQNQEKFRSPAFSGRRASQVNI